VALERGPSRRASGTSPSPPPFPLPPHPLDGPIEFEFELAFWSFQAQLLVVAIGRTPLSGSYKPEEATEMMFQVTPLSVNLAFKAFGSRGAGTVRIATVSR